MPADKPTELSRIKLKTWTRQPVPMISKHSAHSTLLPIGFRTWPWRYTYLYCRYVDLSSSMWIIKQIVIHLCIVCCVRFLLSVITCSCVNASDAKSIILWVMPVYMIGFEWFSFSVWHLFVWVRRNMFRDLSTIITHILGTNDDVTIVL